MRVPSCLKRAAQVLNAFLLSEQGIPGQTATAVTPCTMHAADREPWPAKASLRAEGLRYSCHRKLCLACTGGRDAFWSRHGLAFGSRSAPHFDGLHSPFGWLIWLHAGSRGCGEAGLQLAMCYACTGLQGAAPIFCLLVTCAGSPMWQCAISDSLFKPMGFKNHQLYIVSARTCWP